MAVSLMVGIMFQSIVLFSQDGPKPGDIYKEYSVYLKVGNNWRVTDPNAGNAGAQDFLPNPVLSIDIDDLEGAIRAEAMMDIWGGHVGTVGKQFRFNDSSWIDIPDLTTTPAGHNPECYTSEYNAIVDIPLQYLVEGTNTFEGNSGGQTCYNFNWGQWGWYVMIVRVYYDTEKSHTSATFSPYTSGDTFTENPEFSITSDHPDSIAEVQFIAKYEGYDENGDGIYYDWHHSYHSEKITGHIGSSYEAPFIVTWDTDWIPDQLPGDVSVIARVKGKNGVWYVTEEISNLTFEREAGKSVKMYTASNVLERFWVRAGKKLSCKINTPDLNSALEARLLHRTWNGGDDEAARGTYDYPLLVNDEKFKCYGKNHFYALSEVKVPVMTLLEGTNIIAYRSTTEHHGIEILWPGPALIVKYSDNAEKVANPVFNPAGDTTFRDPLNVKISCATDGASIHYNSGSDIPNQGFPKYYREITVSGDIVIKAVAFKEGMFESNLVTATYTLDTTTLDTTNTFSFIAPLSEGARVFPNPSSGNVQIELRDGADFDNIQLFNNSGQLIIDRIDIQDVVDLASFPSGIYYLVFQGVEEFLVKKILLN